MASLNATTYDFGGAIAANKYGWNAGTRVIDMMPDAIMLSPTETDVLAMVMDSDTLFSASPEWLQISLNATVTTTGELEGADYSYAAGNVPTRVQNVTQIFQKTAEVTGTVQAERHFHTTNLKQQQVDIRFREFMREMEWTVVNQTIANTNESTKRTTRGILEAIDDASNATSTAAAFDEDKYRSAILKPVYDDGAQVTDVFCTDVNQEIINGFAGGTQMDTTRTANARNFNAADKTIYDHVEEVITNYGRVRVHQIRSLYLGDTQVFGIDARFWHWRFLNERSPWMEEPPKDGDRWRAVIQAEGALIHDNGATGSSYTDST